MDSNTTVNVVKPRQTKPHTTEITETLGGYTHKYLVSRLHHHGSCLFAQQPTASAVCLIALIVCSYILSIMNTCTIAQDLA